jgi:transcription antitermination factor NusG
MTCERAMPLLAPETMLFPSDILERATELDSGARWWVIHTRPRAEKSLARKLLSLDLAYYLPTRYQSWLSKGRWFESYLPLFPGYVFLHARPEDRATVLATRTVANFLPVADQHGLIEDLRRVHRVVAAGLPLKHQTAPPPGTAVVVIDGALQGLTGTVVRSGRQAAVYVQVRLIGQGVLVELDSSRLRQGEQSIAI